MYSELLIMLREEQVRLAQISLRRPKINDADASFAYGYACGIHAGLETAISKIEDLAKKENDDIDRPKPYQF